MVAKGKGILAADESTGTIKKRFDKHRLESTEEHRRTYREMLFTTPDAAKWISGVILYDETIRQKTQRRHAVPAVPDEARHHPGHQGGHWAPSRWPAFPGETITEGLDGLRERLIEYYKLGARFAKWRAVIDIGDGIPTRVRHRGQRARAGALCGAVPGARHRADRRAGSADGRRRTRSSAARR